MQRIWILIMLIPLILAQAAEEPMAKIKKAETKACSFIISTSDWKVLSILSLLLSSVFIAGLYIYSSIDSSFIDRAKAEFYQLIFTAILIVFFGFVVSIMCGDWLSAIFGQSESPYVSSFHYLDRLANDYIKRSAINLASAATFLSVINSLEFKNYAERVSSILSWLSDPLSFFVDSLFILFGSLMLAYVITISQINILAIVPYITLMFFIPIGIIFRSIYPFRKFGGALLGLGIGLYVFIPIVLMFNNMLLSTFSPPQMDLEKLELQCDENADCYSQMCVYSNPPGFRVCKPLKNDGEACNSNLECKSGLCESTREGRKCMACGIEGSNNPLCCPGFIRNASTGLCELGKENGEICNSDRECISGRCRSIKNNFGITEQRCMPKLGIGEKCEFNEDCISQSCAGVAPNKVCRQTLVNEEDAQIIISRYAAYVGKDPNLFIQSNFGIAFPEFSTLKGVMGQEEIRQALSSDLSLSSSRVSLGLLYDLIIAPIVLVFIFGVLLPLLNITLISKAVSDLSDALGTEIEIADIWQLI
ncbi:MAG: hypothetical protein NZ903_01940 [Candidatus Micrarchaeota archaeon]|nr:hypothetical protein [Candidatus Micrarchaeota archaeon]